jgi:uroporphyrinogen decarboxylase
MTGDDGMPEQMTSRARVLKALNHKEPDMVPIDLGGTQVTTLTRQAYHNLRAYLGLDADPAPAMADRVMDVVYMKEDLLERYQTDFRPVQLRAPDKFIPREDENGFYDEYGVHWRRAAFYYDAIERPFTNLASIADIEKFPWPDPHDPGRMRGLRETARNLFETTDYALVADICCLGPFEGACTLRGYEKFCMDLYLDPAYAQALLEKLTDVAISLWDVFLNEVGEYVQVVAQGDDLGMQSSTYISPPMIRKFVKPCLKRLYDFIHSRTDAKIFMHSCGSVYDILPDLIEVGVDVLNPIQRSAAKMDITRLKQEFGKDLTFWGGAIDVQRVFPSASLEEIDAEAKHTIDVLAPGGGYVFVPAHNIQPDVSPDRIDKLYMSALRYRNYPVK